MFVTNNNDIELDIFSKGLLIKHKYICIKLIYLYIINIYYLLYNKIKLYL